MSPTVFEQTSQDSAPAMVGYSPCVGGSSAYGDVAQNVVLYGDTLNLTFEGRPPYNLSASVWSQQDPFRGIYCGAELQNLTTNNFVWNVTTLYRNNPRDDEGNRAIFVPNNSIMWVAQEQTTDSPRYFYSGNFTFATVRSAADQRLRNVGLLGWLAVFLALVGVLAI